MMFEKGEKVICTNRCKCFCEEHEIDVGEICTITGTDDGAIYDIRVNDACKNSWWVKSKCFKRVEFKVGDIVTAKKTFVQDSRCIKSDEKYLVVKVRNRHGLFIYLDSIETIWWVPADKMQLANDTKVKEDKTKGDTNMTLKIKNVIFNDPATIVFWEDGVKTVVKCQKGDVFDPEKGLALAISKRVLGNNYAWHGRFMKWLSKPKKGEKK